MQHRWYHIPYRDAIGNTGLLTILIAIVMSKERLNMTQSLKHLSYILISRLTFSVMIVQNVQGYSSSEHPTRCLGKS